jgi:hypothetical protein
MMPARGFWHVSRSSQIPIVAIGQIGVIVQVFFFFRVFRGYAIKAFDHGTREIRMEKERTTEITEEHGTDELVPG